MDGEELSLENPLDMNIQSLEVDIPSRYFFLCNLSLSSSSLPISFFSEFSFSTWSLVLVAICRNKIERRE